MSELEKALGLMPSVLYSPVPASIEALNSFEGSYDPTSAFRRKIKALYGEKATITALYACYYQGWEMDEWMANVMLEDCTIIEATTDHGSLRTMKSK